MKNSESVLSKDLSDYTGDLIMQEGSRSALISNLRNIFWCRRKATQTTIKQLVASVAYEVERSLFALHFNGRQLPWMEDNVIESIWIIQALRAQLTWIVKNYISHISEQGKLVGE